MTFEEQYNSWKKQRAKVEVPGNFADRAMASIHQTRDRVWALLMQRLIMAAGRSRIVRASICVLALLVWMIRVGSVLAIFITQ